MRFWRSIYLFVSVCWVSFGLSQTVNLQLEVVTHLNSPSRLEIMGDQVVAATTGGLLIYDPATAAASAYTTNDGFYSHYFTAITRDSRGNTILGTLDGLLSTFHETDFSIENDQNLQGEVIVDLLTISDTLWVLSTNFVSVYLYDAQRSRYQFRESYKDFDQRVGQFYAIGYGNGRIWLGSDVGLVNAPSDFIRNNLYAVSNWNTLTSADGLPGNSVRDIVPISGNSGLYVATNGGVANFDFSIFQRWPSSNSVINLFLANDQLYGATTRDVFAISETQSQTLYSVANTPITDVVVDSQGDIWVGVTKRGLQNLKSGENVLMDGPLDNYIGETYVDSQRRLWCSAGRLGDTRNQGVFLKTETGWKNFFFFGGTSNLLRSVNSSNPIFEDADGNIWMGSWGGGVVVFEPDLAIQTINPFTDPGSVWIYSASQSDTFAVTTDPNAISRLSPVQGSSIPVTVITDIFMDQNRQSIWILNYQPASNAPLVEYQSTTFGASVLSDGFWQRFSTPSGINQVHKITQDPFGDLWMATSQGVLQIRFGGNQYDYELYTESDNLKNNNTRSIAADFDGYVWCGTESGLSAVLNRQVFDFRELYQPIGLQINDIYVDSQNNKWFATDKGLSILKAQDSPFDENSWIHIIPFNSSLDPEQVAVRPNVYRENLPTEIIHSVFLDESTGDVYLGTQQGLAIIRGNPFANAFTDFEQATVGPNPFLVGEDAGGTLNFRRVVPGSEIKILTANGQLVKRLERGVLDEVQWDGRNMEGNLVGSGVYVYLLTTEDGQEKAGKVLVIRQ